MAQYATPIIAYELTGRSFLSFKRVNISDVKVQKQEQEVNVWMPQALTIVAHKT